MTDSPNVCRKQSQWREEGRQNCDRWRQIFYDRNISKLNAITTKCNFVHKITCFRLGNLMFTLMYMICVVVCGMCGGMCVVWCACGVLCVLCMCDVLSCICVHIIYGDVCSVSVCMSCGVCVLCMVCVFSMLCVWHLNLANLISHSSSTRTFFSF